MIFIVDDDQAARDSLRFRLECEGLEVKDFDSAEAFLDGCRTDDEGCLIVDVVMPGMSGLELLETLRREGSELPAIVVTSLPNATARERAERAHAAFLEKPFNDSKLMKMIRGSVSRR